MKPILILTAGYGEGHNTAARNIAEAIAHLGGEARVVDPFQEAYGRLNDVVRHFYIFSINHAPRLWQLFYNTLDQNENCAKRLSDFKALIRMMRQLFEDTQPGAVISTYPVYNFIINDIYGDQPHPFYQATMVTDSISINALWYLGNSDRYYVPNADTAAVFHNKGINPDKVSVSGFPVQLDFALPERRVQPSDPTTSVPEILYVVNSGKQRAPAVVSRLLKKSDWKITVAVGRDQALLSHIARLCEAYPGRTTVLGWTHEMPKLLMSHHLVITKAGGATVQEAIAAGCPLLINQVVPGQEEGNYELIKANDAGTFASSPEQILERARYCFADDARVWKRWRTNILELGNSRAALDIAAELIAAARK